MAARGQSRRDRRRSERRIRRFTPRMWLVMGGGLLILLVILGVLIASAGDREESGGRYPQIGDHWHATYSITICGASEPPFPVSQGGIHTHGSGAIHIHPNNPVNAGTNATLARFLATTGSTLTNDSLELPSGEEFTNGDPCPDGQTGQIFLRVNGINLAGIADYVPRDDDRIELGFEEQ